MNSDAADIVIIGGGAAGLTAAIFAGEQARADAMPLRIVILDGAPRLGAKILVSGGGRCNVTHDAVKPEDYQGPRHVVRNVLRSFDENATLHWFAEMGVGLKREETGKLFPVTDDAQTVLDALLRRCGELSVEIRTGCRVTGLTRDADGRWSVAHMQGVTAARRVIMATGGKSLPKTGSDGGGWQIVARLGHTVTPTHPALAPLILADGFFHAELSGIAHEVTLSTFVDSKKIDERTGNLLWTHFGVSGPVVMDASRFWIIAHAEGRAAELRCALLPGASFEAVEHWLMQAMKQHPRRGIVTLLAERLPRKVAESLLRHLHVAADGPVAQLAREARRSLVHALTALVLPVTRDRGWNYAEVTAGGVPMTEVDHRTMESRLAPGLHLIGEMLDVDGRIGGFNFQWAWSTGHAAGRATVRALAAAAH